MKTADFNAGAGATADADIVRPAAPAPAPLQTNSGLPANVPLPAIGGSRTSEELEQLALAQAAPRAESTQPASADDTAKA